MKHTPGPWIVDSDALDACFVRQNKVWEYSNENIPICSLLTGEGQDMQANARLIAAAPEMLEMLKQVLKEIEQQGATWNSLKSLIAKAEGNES